MVVFCSDLKFLAGLNLQMQLTHAYGASVCELNDTTCLRNGQLQTQIREHGPLS